MGRGIALEPAMGVTISDGLMDEGQYIEINCAHIGLRDMQEGHVVRKL